MLDNGSTIDPVPRCRTCTYTEPQAIASLVPVNYLMAGYSMLKAPVE